MRMEVCGRDCGRDIGMVHVEEMWELEWVEGEVERWWRGEVLWY